MRAEEVILVTGATGNTGSTLLQQLETRGARVRAMVREQPDGYTITGPAAVTHTEMAGAIAEAIGRQVTFVDVPPQAFASALGSAGVPPWQADGLIED